MWYQRLDVLWDGAEQLALVFLDAPSARVLHGALRIQSATTSLEAPRLIAVFGDEGPGPRFHVMRLPRGHRFVSIEPDVPNAASLHVSLEETIEAGNGAEWRLILQNVSAAGEPDFDSASKAAPPGSTQDAFEALRDDRLRHLRERGRSPSTIVWGVRCMERRTPPRRAGRGFGILAVSPIETIFPESTHIAPIEIEPTISELRVRDEDLTSGGLPPRDPFMPMIAQTIAAERNRRLVHGLRLRTSREDPIVQWVQRRSAIVHVRRQVMVVEQTRNDWLSPVGPRSLPFSDEDIDLIGQTPEEPYRERIVLSVPAADPAIRACSLSQVLSHHEAPMAGLIARPHSSSGAHGASRTHQTTLWFDGAALGDDIGIVSNQAGAMKRLGPDGSDGEATDMLMFRIGPQGLQPIELPEPERQALVRAAARVQPHDADAAGNGADDDRRALDDGHQALDRWYSENLGAPVSVSLDGLEPILMRSAASQLARMGLAAGDAAGPALNLLRHDPALCAILLAHGADAQQLKYVMARRPPESDDLLLRVAHANDVAGLVAPAGVVPEAELEALDILHDAELSRGLVAARIALDSSTRELRLGAQQALDKLANREQLDTLAHSLQVRGRAGDAALIADYLKRSEAREWTSLADAVDLARAVGGWFAERKKVSDQIAAVGASDSIFPASAGGGRRLEDVRAAIQKVLDESMTASDGKTPLAEIARVFNLEALDYDQLLRLESKALTLAYGPARERLINDLLEKLETWANLPRDFLVRIADGEATELSGTRGSRSRRRRGAELLKERVEMLQSWTLPNRAEPRDEFARQRVALRAVVSDRGGSGIGIDETRSEDFEQLVVPIADLFLHHRAFLGLRKISAAARSQGSTDEPFKQLASRLARGLVNWPRGAAETWKVGLDLASRIGSSERRQLDEVLRLPVLS